MRSRLLYSLLLLSSPIFAKAITLDAIDSYTVHHQLAVVDKTRTSMELAAVDKTSMEPSGTLTFKIIGEDAYFKTLKRFTDTKRIYDKLIAELGQKKNEVLFQYMLHSIGLPSREARRLQAKGVDPLPISDQNIKSFETLHKLEHMDLLHYSKDDLLDAVIIMENIRDLYWRYKATLFDPRNKTSVNGTGLLNEGILQMSSIYFQESNQLPGLVVYDTPSLDNAKGVLADPSGILRMLATAFQYTDASVVCFPLNLGNYHWIMLAVQRDGTIVIVDSMGDRSSTAKELVEKLNGQKSAWLPHVEFKPYNGTGAVNTALQHDGYQCGVHSMVYCFAIAAAGNIQDGIKVIKEKIATGQRNKFKDIIEKEDSEVPTTVSLSLAPKGPQGVDLSTALTRVGQTGNAARPNRPNHGIGITAISSVQPVSVLTTAPAADSAIQPPAAPLAAVAPTDVQPVSAPTTALAADSANAPTVATFAGVVLTTDKALAADSAIQPVSVPTTAPAADSTIQSPVATLTGVAPTGQTSKTPAPIAVVPAKAATVAPLAAVAPTDPTSKEAAPKEDVDLHNTIFQGFRKQLQDMVENLDKKSKE